MENMDLTEIMRERFMQFEPSHLEIINESHLHSGHVANSAGASHFKVIMHSPQFTGLSKVAAQRMVYQSVIDLMPFPLHALSLQLK